MRTIPENLLAAFQDQQGLSLKFIIEIAWAEEDVVMYSTCEFEDLEVYAYVKEFGSFNSVSHVEGLGAVSSQEIVFYDQFGHFKDKMTSIDLFDSVTATIYLTLDGTELFDLFEGVISDTASWSNNEFTIEVTSERIEKEIGYQPSIDDVDEADPNFEFLERNLNSSGSWPSLFGKALNYEAPILWKQRVATTEEDVDYEAGNDPTYYELPIDGHDDFTLDHEYFVNIVGNGNNGIFSILGNGEFKTISDEPVFRLTKEGVHSNWYQLIAFTILDSEGIVGETDQPVSRIEINPGEITLDEELLHTLGPDGTEITSVWLQFMKLEIRYTTVTGAVTISTSRYVNCTLQEGNICTLNEKLEIPESAIDVHIKTVSKANDIIYRIPSGSKIYVMGDRVGYVVDTKTSTIVDRVAIKNGEDLVTLDPAVYEVDTDPLWTGYHPSVKYIHMLGEVYMRYIEHYQEADDSILVSAHNTLDTEAETIAEMMGLTTSDPTPNNTNFVLLSVEDAVDLVPEIAWQANKAVRYSREAGEDILELIDLTDTETPSVYSFTEHTVLKGSMVYGFTNKDDLYTIFKAEHQTNDQLIDLETIRLKRNVDKYGESVLDVDFYIFKDKSVSQSKLEWWRDKLSDYHYTIKLTGFMDAFGLEVWDRVQVEFDPSRFYDASLGTPFEHTHSPTPGTILGYGRIKEISPDLVEGLIDFTIEVE